MIRKIYKYVLKHINPKKYAKKAGVSFGSLYTYGYVDWGTEPWIIRIGNNVHITAGVKFITHDGGTLLFRNLIPSLDVTAPIVIGDNVYIGNNALILPGVEIGDNVIIGAGSIVTKNIPSNSVAVGVPAKVIETLDNYLSKARVRSTNLGNLKGKDKDKALMKYFGYKGKSKGIYF